MTPNLGPSLRDAILGSAPIVALLGEFDGESSVHTRRPAPKGAGYPMCMISGDVAITDQDALASFRPVIMRDIAFYGEQPRHYRDVERLGLLGRDLFHRQRFSLQSEQFHVIDIVASGPIIAPTEDDKIVGRLLMLTIRIQPAS